MQHPTCTGIRIRSVVDAQKIFYAVQQGLLRMVTRRLDADERMQLRTGCVYAWEERGPHTELTGLGIERFTEGRRWSPSRVRDEFLFYYEKYSPSPDSATPHPPRDWDPLVKQTYSVWVETEKGRRKWHLTAYFTQATVDQLGSIDNIRAVRDLEVPNGIFKNTRVTKARYKNEEGRSGESSKSTGASRYAPFPAPTLPNQPESSGQVLMYQPYPNHDASAASSLQDPVPPYPVTGVSDSNSNTSLKPTLQDANLYPTRSQPYRPLLPTSRPHPAAGQTHLNVLDHNSQSGLASGTSAATGARRDSTSIPPPQLEARGTLGTSHMSTPGAGLHNSESASGERARSSSILEPRWPADNTGTFGSIIPSMYSGNRHDHPAPMSSSATRPTPHIPHADTGTIPRLKPYQSVQYLTPLNTNPSGPTREPLPPLSILQETYSISYDFSVAMVAQTGLDKTQNAHPTASTSSSSSLQKSNVQDVEYTGSILCKDLNLAPLTTLSRVHTYRREPMDDRALRRLGPRSR